MKSPKELERLEKTFEIRWKLMSSFRLSIHFLAGLEFFPSAQISFFFKDDGFTGDFVKSVSSTEIKGCLKEVGQK